MLLDIRSVKITSKGQIALPKEIRRKKFANGKKLAILAFNDRIELRPLDEINESLANSILSEKSLAKNWLTKEEDKAWKDL